MPFVSISRTVAEATLLEQSQRLIRTERIYRALQMVSADKEGLRVLTGALSRELDCQVMICERTSGGLWTGDDGPAADVRAAVREQRGRLRAGVMARHLDVDRRVLMTTLPTHADALLVCLPRPDAEPDAILLQHAATVCALGISQARLTIEHERRTSAELLVQILDGHIPPEATKSTFSSAGSMQPRLWPSPRGAKMREPARVARAALAQRYPAPDCAPLGSRAVHCRIRAGSLDRYIAAAGREARIGISDPVGSTNRIGEAEKEARWALDIAEKRSVARFGMPKPRRPWAEDSGRSRRVRSTRTSSGVGPPGQ